MKKLLFAISLATLIFSFQAYGQSGMQFAELARRLDPYFAKDLINDIRKQLPQGSDYTIWGWDVGDFSGDDYFDVAFTVNLTAEKQKRVHVYMFVDIDGFLTNVGKFPYEYVDLPLEIGVVIRHNACFVTRKEKQYNWLIRGYTFDNGNLILLDEFTTERHGHLTHETYSNFRTLKNSEKYLRTMSGDEEFFAVYQTIPSYRRGRQIYKGYNKESYSYDIDYVHKGAYYWNGDHDASFIVKSAYDDRYLYMTVEIKDMDVVTHRCDSCYGDFVDVWFDALAPYLEDGDRFANKNGNKIKFRTSSEYGLYCFSFYPGNFLDKKAYYKISTTDDLEPYQKASAREIRVVSSVQDDGFTLKFKVPFLLLGYEGLPMEDNQITEIGATIVFHDIDNEYRPEEETQIASSAFSSLNPSTYGSLLLVPAEEWYGETFNIYEEDIIKSLLEYGF